MKGAIRLVARSSKLRRQRSDDDGLRLVPAHSSGKPVRDYRPPPRHARSGAGWDVRPAPRRRCSTAGASRRERRVDPAGMTPARSVTVSKRHVIVDTGGRALVIQAHPANVQVRDGAIPPRKASRKFFPFIEISFANSAYDVQTSRTPPPSPSRSSGRRRPGRISGAAKRLGSGRAGPPGGLASKRPELTDHRKRASIRIMKAQGCHSYRRASMGSSLAAVRAG